MICVIIKKVKKNLQKPNKERTPNSGESMLAITEFLSSYHRFLDYCTLIRLHKLTNIRHITIAVDFR